MDSVTRALYLSATMVLRFVTAALTAVVRGLTVMVSGDGGGGEERFDGGAANAATNWDEVDESSIPDRIVRSTPLREKRIAKYRGYVAWREEYGIDTILRTPKPYFELIKKYYPHALHKTWKGRNACSIQIEKAGQFGALLEAVRKESHRLERFDDDPIHVVVEHVSFVMTFLFERFDDRPWPLGKTIRIVDMSRLGTDDVAFNVFGFLRVMSDVSKRAFVERIHKIYVLNPPPSFAVIFNTFKPMISAKTQKQIVVCRTLEDFKREAKSEIDFRDVPREYGGSCRCDDCWRDCERERKLRALVRRLNGSSNGSSNEAN